MMYLFNKYAVFVSLRHGLSKATSDRSEKYGSISKTSPNLSKKEIQKSFTKRTTDSPFSG